MYELASSYHGLLSIRHHVLAREMNAAKPTLLVFWIILLASFLSADGKSGASAQEAGKPHVVMLIAEREYETDRTLPKFAEEHRDDFRSTFVFADPSDRNRFQDLESIKSADVLLVSVRRRTLPKEQLDMIRKYVGSGKPVIGIRTASHAFCLRNQDPPEGRAAWPEFDQVVFGGNYTNHHGNGLVTSVYLPDESSEGSAQGTADNLLSGIELGPSMTAGGSLYRVSPLANEAEVLLMGSVEGYPEEPVAWVMRRKDGGKSVYTSLGHVKDFDGPILPSFLANAIQWCVAK